MDRYDIYTVRGFEYFSKTRPCVLVQSRQTDGFDSISVVPFTSVATNKRTRILIKPSAKNGLTVDSYLMVEKLSAVEKSQLGEKVGHLEDKYVDKLKKAITLLYL